MNPRAVLAEFLGTLLLVFFGVGVAVVSTPLTAQVVIPLSFGFVLLALCYAIGPISGCHVNPAVTLGMVICRRISPVTAVAYWVAQFVGAIAGAALLYAVAKQIPGLRIHGAFGTNGYGLRSSVHLSLGGAFLAEAILTFLLVFVVLAATGKHSLASNPGFAGLAIGLALAVCHLIGVPLTGTSVNPARALAPAIFAGAPAMNQVWLFIVAPLVGGLVAAILYIAGKKAPAEQEPEPKLETPAA
ncbi:aquaporin [Mangrovactinospora gilvigrisea]|uniref:Aquaporin n=1 Tax=Mangrovactinospora gilvigrisea TaxID=1428644 RepID=A0A1J7BRY9_9ACTN|nr:MIP family channel protein [Mangrovactinospora gilvigrisea]OIV36225.1 aquaporin [Mangrovactinospora gilvigrisea]